MMLYLEQSRRVSHQSIKLYFKHSCEIKLDLPPPFFFSFYRDQAAAVVAALFFCSKPKNIIRMSSLLGWYTWSYAGGEFVVVSSSLE